MGKMSDHAIVRQETEILELAAGPALSVGTRVRLTVDVERYPHGIARAGTVGTVTTAADTEGGLEGVTLDNPPDWLSEWGGELQWYGHNDDGGPMASQVERIGPTPVSGSSQR